MATLDTATSLAIAASAPVARLATVTTAGTPHVVPCCFVVIGRRLYSVVDGKPKSTTALRRLDNIRATSAVSLVVDHYAEDWTKLWWVRLDGTATIVDDERDHAAAETERRGALAALQQKYGQYRDDPPTGPLIRVDIDDITGWAFNPASAT